MVECSDGTLYTGITKNVEERVREHNSDTLGAKYTRHRRPVILLYKKECGSRSEAAKREYQIKHLNRAKKLMLIQYDL